MVKKLDVIKISEIAESGNTASMGQLQTRVCAAFGFGAFHFSHRSLPVGTFKDKQQMF